MKILGSLLLILGLGTIVSGLFNYWVWYQLSHSKISIESFANAEKQFIQNYDHPFFIMTIIIGFIITYAGVKFYSHRATLILPKK